MDEDQELLQHLPVHKHQVEKPNATAADTAITRITMPAIISPLASDTAALRSSSGEKSCRPRSSAVQLASQSALGHGPGPGGSQEK